MEYREGFTYPIKKGCESMNNAYKIRAMSDEEREYINGTHKAYRIKEGGR